MPKQAEGGQAEAEESPAKKTSRKRRGNAK
jgi:hypothetical protein